MISGVKLIPGLRRLAPAAYAKGASAAFATASASSVQAKAVGMCLQKTHIAAMKPTASAITRAFSTTPVTLSSIPIVRGQKPSIELAKEMPRDFCDMSNDALCIYAAQGHHEAHRERMLREIMNVDQIDWKRAHTKLDEM